MIQSVSTRFAICFCKDSPDSFGDLPSVGEVAADDDMKLVGRLCWRGKALCGLEPGGSGVAGFSLL